jgi:hypothetical protein
MSDKRAPSISAIFDQKVSASDRYTNEQVRDEKIREVEDLSNAPDDNFLVSRFSSEGLSEEEHQRCRELVALLRSGFWLGDFITSHLHHTSAGFRPTPAQLMGELTEAQREWADDVNRARRIQKWWPEVLTQQLQ